MTSTEAQELVRRQILFGTVWSDRNHMDHAEGLAEALQDNDRAEIVAACAELITDPDIRVRSAIVAVSLHLTPDLGAEWLANTLEQHPELYVGVESVGAKIMQPDLEKELLIAIAGAIQPGDSRALALLRKAAHDPGWGTWMLPALSRMDSEWLCARTELIPHRMISVFIHLTPGQREKIVRAKAPWPKDLVDQISSPFWSRFPPDEAKHLRELLEGHVGSQGNADQVIPYSQRAIGNADDMGPAPTYKNRALMVILVGCCSIFFIVFLFWGTRLTRKARNIDFLNKMGDYPEANRLSEQTRKAVNTALIAALATVLLTYGVPAWLILQD